MERKLKEYTKFIEKASKEPTPKLKEFHRMMLSQFQHERLVHLIITLFFALISLIFFIFTVEIFINVTGGVWGNILAWTAASTTFLLIIITLFYVRHYYRLENGVQRLEEITKRFYK